MAISRKAEREILREGYVELIKTMLEEVNYEVLKVKSNELALPCVGCEGNEDWIVITIKVPTGANKGLEPYDGYAEAEDYEYKLKEKADKKKKKEKEKERKIAKDEELRQKKNAK